MRIRLTTTFVMTALLLGTAAAADPIPIQDGSGRLVAPDQDGSGMIRGPGFLLAGSIVSSEIQCSLIPCAFGEQLDLSHHLMINGGPGSAVSGRAVPRATGFLRFDASPVTLLS